MQEGGCVKTILREIEPAAVPARTKQAGEAQGPWAWVERAVWTDRMLEALEKGVKGGVWFSLTILRGYCKGKGISRGKDNIRWPNKYFQDLGYFSLYDAHRAWLQSS